ncbi:MAG: hypothetical protein R3E79_51340 [Caldilineaceae bacterium]
MTVTGQLLIRKSEALWPVTVTLDTCFPESTLITVSHQRQEELLNALLDGMFAVGAIVAAAGRFLVNLNRLIRGGVGGGSAFTVGDGVVAVSTPAEIIGAGAIQVIITILAKECIGFITAKEIVIGCAAQQHIGATFAIEQVIAAVALQIVPVAVEGVVSLGRR